ncbi:hypothetical protein [Jiangella asiatica]|uniref:Uncharacterized protein n=1 Tax=Jiangella asiatica TaxID=2530372 RepID=A0A4R5CG46_9ACTN|nr:hypothetical protein [Jiangella asiatica]TDD97253.1 hypothetical protein E1269_29840 [Jiangella asiatica]
MRSGRRIDQAQTEVHVSVDDDYPPVSFAGPLLAWIEAHGRGPHKFGDLWDALHGTTVTRRGHVVPLRTTQELISDLERLQDLGFLRWDQYTGAIDVPSDLTRRLEQALPS